MQDVISLPSFNSSMVRFGDPCSPDQSQAHVVSIPVWCDLEKKMASVPKGSEEVSIPVWCDLER